MKKCYSLLRWPCLLQWMVSMIATVQNKLKVAVPKETITHHFFVSELGRRKTVDAAAKIKVCRKVKEQKPGKNICKWIARFYYLGIYTLLKYCS